MIRFTQGTVFTLVLLTFTAIIFYLTLDLGPVARLVPRYIVIVTLALIGIQLLLDLFPRLTERTGALKRIDPQNTEGFINMVMYQPDSKPLIDRQNPPSFQKELEIFVWLLLIPLLIYLFGFLTASPLFVFVSFRLWLREGWLISIATAIGLWSLLYGVFVILLGTHLEGGIIWQLLP
jgi:hypothetical protein